MVCDDDGRRSALAAQTLEGMGYTQVSVLTGGINWWVSQNQPTEWGSNVPSKDFGERMEVEHHVPEIEATTLHQWIEDGKKLVILDTRTPEEYQRFCIPGAAAFREASWPCTSPILQKTPRWWSTAPAALAASSGPASCSEWV